MSKVTIGGRTPLFPGVDPEVRFEVGAEPTGIFIAFDKPVEDLHLPKEVCKWLDDSIKHHCKHFSLFIGEDPLEQSERTGNEPSPFVEAGCTVGRQQGEIKITFPKSLKIHRMNRSSAKYLAKVLEAERAALDG